MSRPGIALRRIFVRTRDMGQNAERNSGWKRRAVAVASYLLNAVVSVNTINQSV